MNSRETRSKEPAFNLALAVATFSFLSNALVLVITGAPGPIMGQDEVGTFSRGAELLQMPFGYPSKYYPGTSLFTWPSVLTLTATGSLSASWMVLNLTNSTMLAVGIYVIYRARARSKSYCYDPQANTRICRIPRTLFLKLILLLSPLILTSSTAFPSSYLFLIVCLIWSLLYHPTVRAGFSIALFLLGIVGGLSHPTFLFFSAALALTPILKSVLHRSLFFNWAMLLPSIGIFIGYKLVPHFQGLLERNESPFSASKSSYSEPNSELLVRLLSAPFSLKYMVVILTTSIAYDLLTAGHLSRLFVVVSRRLLFEDRSMRKDFMKINSTFSEMLLSSVLCLLAITTMFSEGSRQRGDDWVYLRYSIPFVLPTLALLLRDTSRLSVLENGRKWRLIIVSVVLCSAGLADGLIPGPQSDWVWANNPSYFLPTFGQFRISLVLGGMAFFWIVFWGRKKLENGGIIVLLVASFVGASYYRSMEHLGHNRESNLIKMASALSDDEGCLVLDPNVEGSALDGMGRYGLDVFRLERPLFLAIDSFGKSEISNASTVGCDDFILSYDMETPGVLIAREAFGGMGLFSKEVMSSSQISSIATTLKMHSGEQIISSSMNERCLRLGCFESVNAAMLGGVSTSRGHEFSQNDPIHGPYASLQPGKYRLTARVTSLSDTTPSPIVYISFTSSSESSVIPIGNVVRDGTKSFFVEEEIEISKPVQMFEVVFSSSLDDGNSILEFVNLKEIDEIALRS